MARGNGNSQILTVPFLSFQADIEVGDVLVTSGLGEVFPAGYPVAEISDVKGIAGEPFLSIEAKPTAEMHKVKNILVVDQPLLSYEADAENLAPFEDEQATMQTSEILEPQIDAAPAEAAATSVQDEAQTGSSSHE